jgi:hypothetical protein
MKALIKTLLNERIFDKKSDAQVKFIELFVNFACKYLKIEPAKVILTFNRDGLVTTASYGNKETTVYAKDRAIVDIMRSIAHELTHMQQDVQGKLKKDNHNEDNSDGSPIENEANAKAGEIIRVFGKKYPQIYK